MDWSKTKSKLIIILLVLNIGLLFSLFFNNTARYEDGPSERTLQELEMRLNNFGVKLNADFPKVKGDIRSLIVKYEEEEPNSTNEDFFQGEGIIQYRDNISQITKEEEEITIINNRRFLYENFDTLDPNSQETNKDIAMDFLEERNYNTTDMALVKTEDLGDSKLYEFAKIYNDKILETSYTRITVQSGKVTTMDRLWIEVIEEDSRSIEIDPAYKALFTLLDRENLKGKTVEKIELCYYFNPEEQGLLEDNTRAERGRAIPAWRITFDDNSTIIVDNY